MMGSMPANSVVSSPPLPYPSSLPSQQHPGSGPESPGSGNMLPSYLTSPSHNADSFAHVGSQKANNSYPMYHNITNGIHPPLGPDFASVPPEHDISALNSQTSPNGFSSSAGPLRNSAFNPFPASSNGRQRHNTSTIRDTSSNFPTSPSYPPVQQQDIYNSNPASLNQQTNPASGPSLDSAHHRYDYPLSASQSAAPLSLPGPTKQPAFSPMDAYRLGLDPLAPAPQMRPPGILGNTGAGTNGILQREPPASLINQHAGIQAHLNGLTHPLSHQNALQSQGPYGTNGPTQVLSSVVNGPLHGSSQQQPQEEISTIFVVGFPDDMSEREFQNMFTFSSGFEAATLKIPNRELTSYGSTGLVSAPGTRINGLPMHSGSNDPYNLVTVNQGGVVVDGHGGTTSSWAAPPIPFTDDGHFIQTVQPPRKQIIGFAKFRTRQEALEARDVLQGRRVDLEKGSVLKAEMAKKNLHTKRGPTGMGPLSGGVGSLQGSAVQTDAMGSGINGLTGINGSTAPGELFMQREKELGALGAMGIAGLGQRRGTLVEEPSSMGLANFGPRGARERAEEDERERERKRKEKEAARLRQNNSAFEAFHSVPQQMVRQGANSLLSAENGTISTNGMLGEPRLHSLSAQSSMQSIGSQSDNVIGPWGNLRDVSASAMSRKMNAAGSIQRPSSTDPHEFFPTREMTSSPPLSGTQSASSGTNPSDAVSPDSASAALPGLFSPFNHQQDLEQNQVGGAASVSSSSSIGGLLNEEELSRAVGALAVSTGQQVAVTAAGTMSPQLPSPSSGTSSSTGRNPGDQNPPINTLYVGNLPASNSPGGSPSPYLEERLRDLFSRRPGYRKLCYRHKSNGPMCFVEFEDVVHASKALNELNGDNLSGLIRGGGIRLSYSKNPLGVRTPTTGGISMQQQSLGTVQTLFSSGEIESFRSSRRDTASSGVTSPTTSYFYTNMSSPPPRFTSPPSFASSLSNSSVFPRTTPQGFGLSSSGSSTFSPFGISPSQSTIPDQPSAESNTEHLPHTLSPVHANVEASRVV
ncbi:hypothetical protein BDY19DRAFT_133842 [Irpex rosettiformis]|uniref:Uncharacterized protein n=1 Tax=Irpex rosettiformis TaxID=378272 RepID=A0ACB8U4Q6_9APHY|nr:hypothetical protein BDY19DRAFT_133842 [Irpex rosettiformis]